MSKQTGFTLPELLIAACLLVSVAVAFGFVYAAFHFIVKFW